MFSMKENHFSHKAKTARSIVKFFDPWERKLAFHTDHNDRMAQSISSEDQERVDVDER